jgi:hypothetical protein
MLLTVTLAVSRRIARHRRKKRADGVCGYLGCHNESTEHYFCDKCREYMRVSQADLRAKRKEPGYVRGR